MTDGERKNPRTKDARLVASGHSEREGVVISQATEQELKELEERIYRWVESKVITL